MLISTLGHHCDTTNNGAHHLPSKENARSFSSVAGIREKVTAPNLSKSPPNKDHAPRNHGFYLTTEAQPGPGTSRLPSR